LPLLFIPLQTTLLVLFVPFPILVVAHSCAELLFVPLQCCYNSLLFSTICCPYLTILLLTIILFTLFHVLWFLLAMLLCSFSNIVVPSCPRTPSSLFSLCRFQVSL
jgi:hypothetical protein